MAIQNMEMIDQADRVRKLTPGISQDIDRRVYERIKRYAGQPGHKIDARIRELEREWNIERSLVLQGSLTALIGLFLGAALSRKWLYLAVVNQFFLFQYSLLGWCPPMVLQRRLGMRTQKEIAMERTALKALRGDFGEMPSQWDVDRRAREALIAAVKR
jgi:hypothetical protein